MYLIKFAIYFNKALKLFISKRLITMATTSKVESILNTREWSWPNGAVFYIQMKLENWETITLGKKSKDAYKVWDEVKYEAYTDANWKQKWKEVKEMPQFAKKTNNSDNNKWAMIGMSIKTAFDLVYKDKWLEEAKKLTKEILFFATELEWDDNSPSC